MRINPVNSAQYYPKPQKCSDNNMCNISVRKSNDVAFTGNYFSKLGAKVGKWLDEGINPPPGSYDKKIKWYIDEAKVGNGDPLIRWIKEDLISSNEINKKHIQNAFDSMPEARGGPRGFLNRALEIMEEKMNPKKKS